MLPNYLNQLNVTSEEVDASSKELLEEGNKFYEQQEWLQAMPNTYTYVYDLGIL